MSKLAIKGGKSIIEHEWKKWPVVGKTEIELIKKVTESGNWSYNGPMETEFKKKWAAFNGSKYTILVANGTVSLQLAWEALGIGYGDEVIVPGLTWQADAATIVDVNAIPILVDIEEDSWCIDPAKIEAVITSRTKAIAAVHFYGTICNMDAIRVIAQKHNLFLLEDCSHQHGSVYKGKKVGTMGDVGSFSLQITKVLTSGEGGILTTDSFEIAEKLDALRNCGRRSVMSKLFSVDINLDTGNYVSEGNFIQSGNYRITEFQAAVLFGQLEKLPGQIALREENAIYLNSKLAQIEGIKPMRREPGTEVQSYYRFAFRYGREAFKGLSVKKFREALSAELNFPIISCSPPLNADELYVPQTKKRHRISDEYFEAINPKRFQLSVATKAFHETSVCAHHKILMGTKEDMDKIAEAVLKIKDNVDELL